MQIEEFINVIQSHGFKAERKGREWRVQCPAHGGKDLNLAVGLGDKGGIVCTCHSHDCTTAEVVRAVGLTMADVAPPGTQLNGTKQRPPPEAIYPYRSENGRTLFYIHRYPGKEFAVVRDVDAYGKPVWGYGNTPRVLFGLPELLKTEPGDVIAIVEGEKDAMNVADLGIAATTNPNGALNWRPEYTDWLKEKVPDRKFLILQDYDKLDPKTRTRKGEEHAKRVFKELTEAGLTAFRVQLPELVEGEDVSDWIKRGGTAEQLRAFAQPPPDPLDSLVYNGPALTLLDVPEPEWLVPGFVAKRVLTLLVGTGKLGKSVLAHQLCVAASSGGVWLDQPVEQTRSLYINFEDYLGLTRARAIQQFHPNPLPEEYHAMEPPWGTPFLDFLSWLERFAIKNNIGLIVIDPLGIAAAWKNENDNSEVTITTRRIQEVAQRTGAAILVVHHVRKSSGEHGEEVRGGSAIFAGLQGFLSFKRSGPGEYQLDTKDKMPGKHGGEKSFLLRREAHTLTWHVTQHLQPQEQEKYSSIDEVIGCIRADPGISRTELGEITGLSKATLSRYIKPLVDSGTLSESTRMKRPGDSNDGPPPKGLFVNERRSQGG